MLEREKKKRKDWRRSKCLLFLLLQTVAKHCELFRELKNIPNNPLTFLGSGRCRCLTHRHKVIFFFLPVCSLLFQTVEKTEIQWVKDPQSTQPKSQEQNSSHFIHKCSNRDCRNVQKCRECSYRHSSSLDWGSHQSDPSKNTNSKHHNSEYSLSKTISTGKKAHLIYRYAEQ